MSDQSIAFIARSLAAALRAACGHPPTSNEEGRELKRVAELETELCAAYQAELKEAVKVIA